MKALELRIPPVALVILFGASMWLISRASPRMHFPVPGAAWLSAGMAMVGICIALIGVLEFRRVGTTVDPRVPDQSETLVVHGVYRFSRNPMYVGFFLVLCAWGLFLNNVPSLFLLPAFILYMNRFQIVPEERFMQEKFSESYSSYRSTVRRWI